MLMSRDDDFGAVEEVEEKQQGSSSLGSAGSLSTSAKKQRALDEQKQRLMKQQQQRRGTSRAVKANHAFTGASRKIPTTRTGSQFPNFSAPKAIDPLEGEDDLDHKPTIRKTGYADSFRGSSRNASGSYGGVYESLHRPEASEIRQDMGSSHVDPRVANVVDRRQNGAPEDHEGIDGPSHPHTVESKYDADEGRVEKDAKRRGSFSKSKSSSKDEGSEAPGSGRKKRSSRPSKSTKLINKPSLSDDSSEGSDEEEVVRRSSNSNKEVSERRRRSSSGTSSKQRQRQQRQEEREIVDQEARAQRRRGKAGDESVSEDEEEVEEVIAPKLPPKQHLRKKKASSKTKRSSAEGKMAEQKPRDAEEEDEEDDEQKFSGDDEFESVPRGFSQNLIAAPELDFSDIRALLMNPLPKSYGTIQCYVERNKSGTNKLYPEYQVFLKDGDRFLMSAKKRSKNRTSNYVVTLDPKDSNRESVNCLGKLRANFLGTEFQIFDKGINPKNSDPDSLHVGTTPIREELGSILYASNVLGSRGPRKMKVGIPKVDEDGERVRCRPTRKGDELLSRFKERDMAEIIELINKPPRWNDHVGAYVLNFNGRVTMASVKNFQLITTENEDDVVLTFGRCGANLFSMDVAYPLSIYQAFCIALSSMVGKLACE